MDGGFLFPLLLFVLLVLASAFFSSAETSVLTISRARLGHRAKRKDRPAVLLSRLLERPEEFLSTILVGNNLVNVAAASVATFLLTRFFRGGQGTLLVISSLLTTLILLVFGEITPKSYAYRHAEKLAFLYARPVRFFAFLFSPLVKALSLLPKLFFRRQGARSWGRRELSLEEIKHFLSMESQLFRDHPETLRMLTGILDVSQKDIKAVMTPRVAVTAIREGSSPAELRRVLLEKGFSRIPLYRGKLDNITGIIDSRLLLRAMLSQDLERIDLRQVAARPIFVSEYSSLNTLLNEFKKHQLNLAVVLDEYGSTIGIITLGDVLRGILGDLEMRGRGIQKLGGGAFLARGSLPVEEVNTELELDLPERKDYTTLSGLFIYEYGRLPQENARVQVKNCLLVARKMGRRKIEEVVIIRHEDHRPE